MSIKLYLAANLIDSELIYSRHFKRQINEISESDILLIITHFDKYKFKDPERYVNRGPGFSEEAASYIIEKFPNLKALGLDTISLASIQHINEGMEAHKIFKSYRRDK